MAGNQLFPIFDTPEAVQIEEEQQQFKRSFYFDYETGDFVRDGGNRVQIANEYNAWAQWCMKVIQVERYSRLAYGSDIGIEAEEVRRQPTQKAAESVLERTITEALLVHPMTEAVRGFSFSWYGDSLTATFTAYSKEGASVTVSTTLTM